MKKLILCCLIATGLFAGSPTCEFYAEKVSVSMTLMKLNMDDKDMDRLDSAYDDFKYYINFALANCTSEQDQKLFFDSKDIAKRTMEAIKKQGF